MGNRRRDRKRKPARRKPYLEPKPLLLVVCEGEVTEPQYLRGFAKACRNPRVKVVIADDHGAPKTLVEKAKEYKVSGEKAAQKQGDDHLAFDQVWCVFDVDNHPNMNDAIQQAKANGIHLAVSNPSFELWLLLHFADHAQARDRVYIRAALKKHLPDYDKQINFQKHFADGYPLAVTRAQILAQRAESLSREHHQHNPSTGVFLLSESIREE